MVFSRVSLYTAVAISCGIYLFVQAPERLAPETEKVGTVPVQTLFEAVNTINATARQIYTKQIVGPGTKVGLKFDADWQENDVFAGPLPAIFLRTTAHHLERDPAPLGLFLGSEYPINTSNLFSDEQKIMFAFIQQDQQPRYGEADGSQFGMFADLASDQACVTCHNEHVDSPRDDWRLGGVMGATTWTWPVDRGTLTIEQFMDTVDAVYRSIALAYEDYLVEAMGFEQVPEIGSLWPKEGYVLPDRQTFMLKTKQMSAHHVLGILANARRDARNPDAEEVAGRNP
jgi:adenylate cyclase